jgi:hypothetical protein
MTEFSNNTKLITGISLEEALRRASLVLKEKVIPRYKEYSILKAKLNERNKTKLNDNSRL